MARSKKAKTSPANLVTKQGVLIEVAITVPLDRMGELNWDLLQSCVRKHTDCIRAEGPMITGVFEAEFRTWRRITDVTRFVMGCARRSERLVGSESEMPPRITRLPQV